MILVVKVADRKDVYKRHQRLETHSRVACRPTSEPRVCETVGMIVHLLPSLSAGVVHSARGFPSGLRISRTSKRSASARKARRR